LAASSASAQSSICDCYGGYPCEIRITSQAELDVLADANCTTIFGDLYINSPNLTNINGLESIGIINESLIIQENLLLTDLDGLTNIREVRWDLLIRENDVLESIAGLDNLVKTSGDTIDISWNPSLDDLTPLYGTDVLGNSIFIKNNQILSMLDAFALVIQLSPPNGIFNGSSTITGNGVIPDLDNDGILDNQDNCPVTPNPGQEDADNDLFGDACDTCPNDADNDADSDGHCADDDNCPLNCNTQQLDGDGDGDGDVCEEGGKAEKGCSEGCGSPSCEQEC
jgi:hypothetical protein